MSTCIQHTFAAILTTVQCRAVAEGEEVSVQHIFSLVMAPTEGTPRSTVYIRLLGPFSARSALSFHACTTLTAFLCLPCCVNTICTEAFTSRAWSLTFVIHAGTYR